MQPDLVVCSGDLTTFGFKQEYHEAQGYLDQIECEAFVVIPGNHDSRNVGYVHFEELFGDRSSVLRVGGITFVAVDSTQPDLDEARSAAAATAGSRSSSPTRPTCGSSSCTTTCCRSRAPAASATSSSTRATRSSACSAPASTSCSPATSTCRTPGGSRTSSSSTPARSRSMRLRGNTRPCYNVVEITGSHVDVWRKYPFHGSGADHPVLDRDAGLREVHGPHRGRGHVAPLAMRCVAVIDGEHYAPVVRAALAELPYEVVGALLAGGTEKLRGGDEYGVPLGDRPRRGDRRMVAGRRLRPLRRAGARPARAACAREPGARRAACRTRGPTSASSRPSSTPVGVPSLAVVGTGKRVGQDGGHGARRPAAGARPARGGRRDGPRRAARAGARRDAARDRRAARPRA